MFEVFRSPSRSAAGAIKYVTVGTLMVIWAGLWYYYFLRPLPNPPAWQSYLCMATIFSGVAIGIIGLLFGMIGRGAKAADNTVGGVDTSVAVATPAISTPVVATPVMQAPVGTRVDLTERELFQHRSPRVPKRIRESCGPVSHTRFPEYRWEPTRG